MTLLVENYLKLWCCGCRPSNEVRFSQYAQCLFVSSYTSDPNKHWVYRENQTSL